MAEIYVITNKINGKQYVGKTNRDSETRLKEHFKDRDYNERNNRPFYKAINKYGKENFELTVLYKDLTPEEANQIEIETIDKLDTFNNGYNATVGGDGKTYRLISEDSIAYIIHLYVEKEMFIKDIARELNTCAKVISQRLKDAGIKIEKGPKGFQSSPVTITKKDLIINFDKGEELIDYLIDNKIAKTNNRENVAASITRVLRGARKTYLGFNITN